MKLKERNMKERGGSDRGTTASAPGIMVTPGFDHQSSLQSGGPSDAALAIAASQPIPPHDSQYSDQAQFEADKRSVYKHPLFPLLALLFEKCEMATQTTAESPISDSFHQDLEAFVQHQERDRKPFLANDPEIDGLMVKAIQVLRIHLLELDKVQELCKDFCNRYITCLKGKMQSENLLRSDYYDNGSGHNGSAHISSHSNSPHHSYSSNGEASVSPPNGVFHLQNPGMSAAGLNYPLHSSTSNLTTNHSSQQSPGSSILGGHPSPEEHLSTSSSNHHHHSHSQASASAAAMPLIHGGTPLSQIGANICPPVSLQDTFVQTPQSPSSAEDEDEFMGRKKPKRGVLPKHATSIMRSWLFQHIVHPYPTEDEKRQIAGQTNLTLLQVNNWFINARRRILQPMLDASNPEAAATPKVKKVKTHSSKPALKYWSDNLASISSSGQIEGIEDSNGLDMPEDSSDDLDESSNDGNDLLIDNSDSSQP